MRCVVPLFAIFASACALSHDLREWDGSVVRANMQPHRFGRGFVEIAADGSFVAQRLNQLERCTGTLTPSERSAWLGALEDVDVVGRDGMATFGCDHCPAYEVELVSASGAEGRITWNGRVPRELDALSAVLRATLDRAGDCTQTALDASTARLSYTSWLESDDLGFSLSIGPGGPPTGFVASTFPEVGDAPDCPDAITDEERTPLVRRTLDALPEPPLENAVEHRLGGVHVWLRHDHDAVMFYVDPASAVGTELTDRALRCPRLD